MVESAPELGFVQVYRNSLSVRSTYSKFEPIASDSDKLDGLNTHGALNDELHAWKSRDLWDVMDTSTGSRRNWLIWSITTAGHDRKSICWEQHDYSVQVLNRVIDDDSHFAFIAALDEGDDWRDPKVWRKANPNLGISVYESGLAEKVQKAIDVPGRENACRRLQLNEWTQQDKRWLSLEKWDKGAEPGFTREELQGRECYGGLDLASTTDISALALVFKPIEEGEKWKVLLRYWVPEDRIAERVKTDRVPYDVWARQGWIEPTEGNICDYDVIRERVKEDAEYFNLRELAYDRWNSTHLVTQLSGDGLVMVPFGQGFASMAAPTKEVETLVIGGRIAHRGDPVLRWMVSNVAVRQDPAGNLKPDKEKSAERIDGVVAMVMGFGRAMARPIKRKSVYDDPDWKPAVIG